VAAVQQQAALGSTYFALNEPVIRLAEKMVEAVPCGEAIRFQTTGSEATFAALRLARAVTGRDKILKFEGGWHGGRDGGQLPAMTGTPRPFPEPVPDCNGIPAGVRQEVLVAPFNNPGVTAEIVDQHHAEIAAIIVEPLQRALRPEPGFLQSLRTITKK